MVHAYSLFDKNIVLDVESGFVHVVDDLFLRVLSSVAPLSEAKQAQFGLTDFAEDEIVKANEALQELLALKDKEQLFCASADMDSSAFTGRVNDHTVKALCLNVAHDCNMDCIYCFAGKGSYSQHTSLMDADTAKAAIDFLISQSGTRRHLEVDFFGGEPLLNQDVVKTVVAYARSLERVYHKRFRFTLTTNGLLLDDAFAEFANAELDNVVLSLDGRKTVNDSARKTKNGKSTYDLVTDKIKRFSELRGDRDHYIRGTFTHFNTDFCADVAAMADLGFQHISLEPVTAPPEADYAITNEDIPVILSEYEKLAKYILEAEEKGREINFFHFNIDLDGGPCLQKLISGCGAGRDYLAVSPDGLIYPCHQFVGNDEYAVGSIKEGIKKTDVINKFAEINLLNKPDCQGCFAKYYCGGGCMANGYKYAGGLDRVYSPGCQMLRKRVECAIAMRAVRATRQ